MAIVVDASVTMAWIFEDEASPATEAVLDRLLDEPAAVPAIWPFEVANVLAVAERRGRLTEAQARRLIELLLQLPIEVVPSPPDLHGVVSTARRHRLSAYDAAYLVLAEQLGAAVATLDQELSRACRDAGVLLVVSA